MPSIQCPGAAQDSGEVQLEKVKLSKEGDLICMLASLNPLLYQTECFFQNSAFSGLWYAKFWNGDEQGNKSFILFLLWLVIDILALCDPPHTLIFNMQKDKVYAIYANLQFSSPQ